MEKKTMIHQINFGKIVKDHYKTLEHPYLFTIISIAITIILLIFTRPLSVNLVNVLIMAFAIFAGLMFNLLLLVFDIVKKLKDMNEETKGADGQEVQSRVRGLATKKELNQEIYKNISFSIIVSVTLIMVLIVYSLDLKFLFIYKYIPDNFICEAKDCIKYLLSGIVYFLIIMFTYTLYMILKRIYYLLLKETA